MALTDAQIETVREIAGEPSLSYVAGLVANLTPAQEAATVEDIAAWGPIRDTHLAISGGKTGVSLNFDDNRTAIRVRVRLRLGIPATGPTSGESLKPSFFGLACGSRGE